MPAITTENTAHRTHRRVLTLLLVALCAFYLTPPFTEVGAKYYLLWFASFMLLFGSQFFWVGRVLHLAQRFIPGKLRRVWLEVAAAILYGFFFIAYSFAPFKMLFTGHAIFTGDPRIFRTVIDGIFSVWLVGSVLGFSLIVVLFAVSGAARSAVLALRWARRAVRRAARYQPDTFRPDSPGRRRFVRQFALSLGAVPFAGAAYGLLYSRLDLEVTHYRVALPRLPNAFQGFRIAQLSDFHVSSFMPLAEIRRCVSMTNQLKPDLVVLTGDYLSWDPAEQMEVVQALSGLRAPYGVLGCLGNHEVITRTEDSITRLFASNGIRILRQERASVQLRGERLNFIGVDDSQPDISGIERLVTPEAVNILLVHEIGRGDFDRAAQYDIDLTLTGHTHGGQLSLEFLHRGLCLSRLETPYVRGWYEKSGRKLYVNRGIGTTMIPIRLGARPEITLFELVRSQ